MGNTAKSEVNSNLNSDMMHNYNCFLYLNEIKKQINPNLSCLLTVFGIETLSKLDSPEYDKDFAYGNLYTQFIAKLEEELDILYLNQSVTEEISNDLDHLIHAIYHNDNHILEQTAWLINPLGAGKTPQKNTSKAIQTQLEENNTAINLSTPQKSGSTWNQLLSLFTPNCKPQHATNIPSVKHYSYKDKNPDLYPIEYRFGTQAQRHNGTPRISPLFKRWLAIQAKKSSVDKPINYIYFNNLGLDRSVSSLTGSQEKKLTETLHELEQDPNLRVAVITLPAHEGLMDDEDYQSTTPQFSYTDVTNELLKVAKGEKHTSGVSDFWMSEKTKQALFDGKDSTAVLEELLTKSFKAQGISPQTEADKATLLLSKAQRQAVWLHFIKFEFTNYILKTIEPVGYNFTCKDAIDRGALSSVYYNLIKSIELVNQPLQKEEFERAIDAAATIVKGRGMNFHRTILWNALDGYINANYDKISKDPRTSWLIYWRDMNCPHERVEELTKLRIKQCKIQFELLTGEKTLLKKAAENVLSRIKTQVDEQFSGQRVLLEILSRTSELVNNPNPSPADIQRYNELSDDSRINHGGLYVLGGLMKVFLSALLFLLVPPSCGYTLPWIKQGWATAKCGFFASERNELCDEMKTFSVGVIT